MFVFLFIFLKIGKLCLNSFCFVYVVDDYISGLDGILVVLLI